MNATRCAHHGGVTDRADILLTHILVIHFSETGMVQSVEWALIRCRNVLMFYTQTRACFCRPLTAMVYVGLNETRHFRCSSLSFATMPPYRCLRDVVLLEELGDFLRVKGSWWRQTPLMPQH